MDDDGSIDEFDQTSHTSRTVTRQRSTNDDEWLMVHVMDVAEVAHGVYRFHSGVHDPLALIGIVSKVDNAFFNEHRYSSREEYYVDRLFDVFL